jgi:hypothetical protein
MLLGFLQLPNISVLAWFLLIWTSSCFIVFLTSYFSLPLPPSLSLLWAEEHFGINDLKSRKVTICYNFSSISLLLCFFLGWLWYVLFPISEEIVSISALRVLGRSVVGLPLATSKLWWQKLGLFWDLAESNLWVVFYFIYHSEAIKVLYQTFWEHFMLGRVLYHYITIGVPFGWIEGFLSIPLKSAQEKVRNWGLASLSRAHLPILQLYLS